MLTKDITIVSLNTEDIDSMVEEYMRKQIVDFVSIDDIIYIDHKDDVSTIEVHIRRQNHEREES